MARRPARGRTSTADPRFAAALDGASHPALPVVQAIHSPATDAYSRELARIQRIQAQMTAMDAACQAYVQGDLQRLQPLRVQLQQAQRAWVLQLAHWLHTDSDALSRQQRSQARQHLCQWAQALAEQGDADMAALHDAHSPQTLADRRRTAADALRARLADWLAPDNTQAHATDDPDAVLQAAREQWHKDKQAQQAQRAARQAKRAARKAQREPTPAAQLAAETQEAAGATLRRMYRRLASALHPDRASNEAERERMHNWMSAANAAYDRQDLLTLLDLQGQLEQVDPRHLERSSTQRLQALTVLLKQQAASLERERQLAQQRWWHQLGLEPGASLTEPVLRQRLDAQYNTLAQSVRQSQADLARVTDLAGFKAWLNAQRPGYMDATGVSVIS
jgi:hypothetical protein